MRRIVLATVALACLPAVVLGGAVPAAAATSTLTVTLIGRAGNSVSAPVNVVASDGTSKTVQSGTALTLTAGTYAVLTDIWNTNETTDTLAAKTVAVSGATKLTLDARGGKLITVNLDSNPTGYDQGLSAAICYRNEGFGAVSAWNAPGQFYVLPNSSSSFNLSYMSSWLSPSQTDSYTVDKTTTGIPAGVNTVFTRASLATVNYVVRTGPNLSTSAMLWQNPLSASSRTDCTSQLMKTMPEQAAPFTATAHLSPGRWELRTDTEDAHGWIGYWYPTPTLSSGQTYPIALNRAVWGPEKQIPIVLSHTLSWDQGGMFSDPVIRDGWEGQAVTKASLSKGSTVLSTQSLTYAGGAHTSFGKNLTSAGWYTLSASSTRFTWPDESAPAGLLSAASSVRFHFYVNPATNQVVPGILARFIPGSLNSANQAVAGSTTTVALALDRSMSEPDAPLVKDTAKTVLAWASTDSGKTWKQVTVTHSGSSWSTKVVNPTSGAVSLRAEVIDAAGNSTTVTVIRAYAIAM